MPFIFPRRFVQECLNRLRVVLTNEEHSELVARLNRRSPQRLAAMWEAVMLSCFVDQPYFQHEAPLENGRKPDFQFQLSETGVFVTGDITCVSDKGPKKDNPIEQLMADIGRIARKHGSDLSQFEIRVNGISVGDHRKRKVALKLPKGEDRQKFLKKDLTPYIVERLKAEDYGHKKAFNSGEYDIEVTFKPLSQFTSYGHPSFTSVLHIDRNPVWNALKSKAEQLRGASAGALRMIVLCDGGCEAMRDRGLSSSIGRDEIVRDFLRRETGIDIVVSMTVKDEQQPMGQSRRVHNWALNVREAWLQADVRNQAVTSEVRDIVNAFESVVPMPASNAQSAEKNCLTMDYGIGAWGYYKMSRNRIEISGRSLQRVLAGDVSIEDFNRDHGWPNGNRFASALANGQTISSMTMSRKSEDDDDYIEIVFSPDASLSPFK